MLVFLIFAMCWWILTQTPRSAAGEEGQTDTDKVVISRVVVSSKGGD